MTARRGFRSASADGIRDPERAGGPVALGAAKARGAESREKEGRRQAGARGAQAASAAAHHPAAAPAGALTGRQPSAPLRFAPDPDMLPETEAALLGG